MDFTKCKIATKCLEKKLLHMFLCVSLFFLHYESSTIVKAYIQFKALLKIERLRKQMRVSDEHNQQAITIVQLHNRPTTLRM